MDLQDYKNLNTSEKVLLLDEIAFTKNNKKLLDERLKTYQDFTKRTSWEEIKRKVALNKKA